MSILINKEEEYMKTQDAINHYGDIKKLADTLDMWPQAVYAWGEYPPKGKQYEIQVKSEGKLKAETE